MKNTMFFVGVIGMALVTGVANAANGFPDDAAANTYPEYIADAQTPGGTSYAAEAVRDKGIKLATTKYVNKHADAANSDVQQLSNTANTDNTTVTTNANNITTLTNNRQVITNNENECVELDTNVYSGCGYIAPDGADANNAATAASDKTKFQWVKIIAAPTTGQTTGA